ncbi:MAG: acetylxylan esterase [Candidatus Hinthialibacter antarcticus]|nr:acetylxylan esterase [Candidatus Hinthialibacter antarcticus]
MKRFFLPLSIIAALVLNTISIQAEIEVKVEPNHEDWVYQIAEPIQFQVSVLDDGKSVQGNVRYSIGPEQMAPFQSGNATLEDGKTTLKSHGLDRPGFLRCMVYAEVDGKSYKGLATGAYDAPGIKPTTPMPDDFDDFWQSELAEMRNSPLEPELEFLEDQSNDKVDCYHVSFNTGPNNWRYTPRFYGMLAVPKGDGPFPGLLQVPGAGVRAYRPQAYWAEQGIIHLTVGIHGIPVNLPDRLYNSLNPAALRNYFSANLDDRDEYYYNRVFLGCARAVDFIVQLDQFDGKTLGIHGGSQGGALSITTAGLDPRIRFVASTYPALCDHYGYLNGRAGGWPHLFKNMNPFTVKQDKIETAAYYDVVNFARKLDMPVLMGLGYNDETCPPTSMFSAYNSIPSEKEIQIIPYMGHWTDKKHSDYAHQWLMKHLKP